MLLRGDKNDLGILSVHLKGQKPLKKKSSKNPTMLDKWLAFGRCLTWSGVCCFIRMDIPFRIPKKKQPSNSEPAHLLMQSPLSCLQPSTPNAKVDLPLPGTPVYPLKVT